MTLTPSDGTYPSPAASSAVSRVQLRIGDIGEVTGFGACWSLVYDRCDHVQEFAREGLEQPDRLVQYVQRNFAECLTCRLLARRVGGAS